MSVYYNENDPKIAHWLRELMKHGLIPKGDLDERSIKDVDAKRILGHTQAHFFAGIGGWAEALRLTGIGPDFPLWSGSCPCTPFSSAGKRLGFEDERHLWPDWYELISECRPAILFGEKVSSKDGRIWFSRVRTDLEALGYAVGCADLCAAGIGAPHIRQRLYWGSIRMANTDSLVSPNVKPELGVISKQSPEKERWEKTSDRFADLYNCSINGVENTTEKRLEGTTRKMVQRWECRPASTSEVDGMVNFYNTRSQGRDGEELQECPRKLTPWEASSSISCRDGKYRRIPLEPTLFPLVDGFPKRVVALSGLGNAIVPQLAAEFILSFLEACEDVGFISN